MSHPTFHFYLVVIFYISSHLPISFWVIPGRYIYVQGDMGISGNQVCGLDKIDSGDANLLWVSITLTRFVTSVWDQLRYCTTNKNCCSKSKTLEIQGRFCKSFFLFIYKCLHCVQTSAHFGSTYTASRVAFPYSVQLGLLRRVWAIFYLKHNFLLH